MPVSNQHQEHAQQLEERSIPSSSLFPWTPTVAVTSLVAVAVSIVLYWTGFSPETNFGGYPSTTADWDLRRQDVKEAFISSWDAYSKYAWGQSLTIYSA